MRNIVRNVSRLGTRNFSTSQYCYDAIRSLRNQKYLALVHKETRSPIWRLLDALRQSKHVLVLSTTPESSRVSVAEFDQWKSLLHEPSIESVPHETLRHAPTWVALYFISNKVRTAQQAHGPMLTLFEIHLETVHKRNIGPLILLTAIQLARFNLVVPLYRLAQTFLSTWIDDPLPYFNLFLQIISCIPNRTVESANIAVLLLKAMESRQLKLTSDTYKALLNDRFVTLQLTKYLQSRMAQEGFIPQTSHLEAYLRFFAKDGAIHDAEKYYEEIRSKHRSIDRSTALLSPSSVPRIRANTLLLGAQSTVPLAFDFLYRLSSPSSHARTLVLPKVKRRTGVVTRLLRTKFLSVHDFTATFSVAVRDVKLTSSILMKLFTRVPGGRPTVATYTLLIRGLLLRRDTVNAVAYWKKFLKSGVAIDSEALATGIVTLTHAKRPHDAFTLLEQFGERPDGKAILEPGSVLLRKRVKVTQKTINDYMVALNRIYRPDIVFRIWDYMERLYDVRPNDLSLRILLQSARLAHKLDDTLTGALAQLSLKNPFRRLKSQSSPAELDRGTAVSAIRELFHLAPNRSEIQKSSNGNGYTSGIWHGLAPATAARKVFLQCLFGMVVETENGQARVQEMFDIGSPAAAVRTSPDHDPAEGSLGLGFGLGLRRLRPAGYVFEKFDDLFPVSTSSVPSDTPALSSSPPTSSPRIRSHYPSIAPTNAACLQYILLLAISARSNEIPLLLAWMKYLHIQPSSSTLALCLAAWSEVSVQAPLVERFQTGNFGPEGREYVKLTEWIKDWVGEERIPSAKEVEKWWRIIEKVRERRQ